MNIEELKKGYRKYMEGEQLAPLTIQTAMSDSFFLLRCGYVDEFWQFVKSGQIENEARELFINILKKNGNENPEINAHNYASHLRRFSKFYNSLDTKGYEYSKFKKLLEWFVTQLKINNDILSGAKIMGFGHKGHSIREKYKEWRSYNGFDLDCSIQLGYNKATQANYINYSWINIVPFFVSIGEKKDVSELGILVKPGNTVKTVGSKYTISQLGLFDGKEPNDVLKDFFEEYKGEILSFKGIDTQKPTSEEKKSGGEKPFIDIEKNMILYGPPGTGKTYHTIFYAVSIIEGMSIDELKKEGFQEVSRRYLEYREKGYIDFVTFHQSYGYEEFMEGIKPIVDNKGQMTYRVTKGAFKGFCEEAEMQNSKRFVFVIDEINRGNISKILGEAITLIEPTKRKGEAEATLVTLPYSAKPFGVPNNVYIIGTMNTADRSIAMMDTALRRRFSFKEMMPDLDVLKDIIIYNVSVAGMLERMNKRIEYLYDREHTIGHAYFLPLKERANVTELGKIFENKILPLLQEYFYDDYEKIALILGDNQKESDEDRFIVRVDDAGAELFGESVYDLDEKSIYKINKEAFYHIKSYKFI